MKAVARWPEYATFVAAQQARLELAAGKRDAALEKLRAPMPLNVRPVDRENARYLLTYLLGTDAGSAQCLGFEDELRSKGVDARAYLASLYPELFNGR